MTRRALFLHGTNGSPEDHWWPWLKDEFENTGYTVWAPQLPGCDRPNANTYWKFLHSNNWDFADNVLVGHSSGATSVLNLLARPDFPRAKAAVLVGAFLNEDLTSTLPSFESGQFADLFPAQGFDWSMIQQKAEKFYFVHGDDDPYCSYNDATIAAELLKGELITILNGGHLSTASGIKTLPDLTNALKEGNLL